MKRGSVFKMYYMLQFIAFALFLASGALGCHTQRREASVMPSSHERADTPALAPAHASGPSSPVFYRTERSDEWVERTMVVEAKYSRVDTILRIT